MAFFKTDVNPKTNRIEWSAMDRMRHSRTGGIYRSYASSRMHTAGKDWIRMELGLGKYRATQGLGTAFKWLGRGFVGFSAVQGFREGGLSGAIGATGTYLATTYALGAGLKGLGIAAGGIAPVAGMAAAGTLAVAGATMAIAGINPIHKLASPYVREHMKKHARLEMGSPAVDNFGTISTMRQRSLMAIQNSRLNGRTALGNEAALMYQPYFR